MKKFNAVFFTDYTDTVLVYRTLGVYKLCHQLRKENYTALGIDHFHMFDWQSMENLLHKVISEKTKFVGISVTHLMDVTGNDVHDPDKEQSYTSLDVKNTFAPQGKDFENKMVETIKTLNPNCKIVIGGHIHSQTVANQNIDYAIRGHCEKTIVEFMRFLENKKNNIKIDDHSRPAVIHGDEPNSYEFTKGGMIWNYEDVLNAKVLPIETARGCIFNCKFCSYPLRGKKKLDYILDENLLYQELESNYENLGITHYSLIDDTFNDSEEKLDQILKVVKKLQFQPIFWCYARLDLLAMKKQRLEKMYDIGVRSIFFGIETLNQPTGKIIGKGFDPDKQVEMVRLIRDRYGNEISTHGSFIIGMPEESIENSAKTAEKCLSQELPLHSWHFKPLYIRQVANFKSQIEQDYIKYGYEIEKIEKNVMYWKNQKTSFIEAKNLANDINKRSYQHPRHHLANQTSWSLLNYDKFDLERCNNMLHKDVDWNEVSNEKINLFNKYNKMLLNFVSQNN